MVNLLRAKPIAIALTALLGIGVVSGQANDDSTTGTDLADTGAAIEQVADDADQAVADAEKAAEAEAERKAAEEAAAKVLAEQKAAEEAAAKAQAEQKAAEEAVAKAEAERVAAEQAAKEEKERKEAEAAAQAKEQSAASQNNGYTVYITNTGKKYHSDGCSYLKKSKIAIDINDAKARGLTPCSKCNP